MRWVGERSALWRVRVDLFVEDDDDTRVRATLGKTLLVVR